MYYLVSSQQPFWGGGYRYPPHFVDQETEVSGLEPAATHIGRDTSEIWPWSEELQSVLLSLCRNFDTNGNVTQTQTVATVY